jgi:translation initiation factor 5A
MSDTHPVQCSALRKGGYVMLKGFPCRVVALSVCKPGKHGHAKCNIVGRDIFTGNKYEDDFPTTQNVDVPNVKRSEYPLMAIEDGYVQVLNEKNVAEDYALPPGQLGVDICTAFADGDVLVTVQEACSIAEVVAFSRTAQ